MPTIKGVPESKSNAETNPVTVTDVDDDNIEKPIDEKQDETAYSQSPKRSGDGPFALELSQKTERVVDVRLSKNYGHNFMFTDITDSLFW